MAPWDFHCAMVTWGVKGSPPAMQLFANLSFPMVFSHHKKWIYEAKMNTSQEMAQKFTPLFLIKFFSGIITASTSSSVSGLAGMELISLPAVPTVLYFALGAKTKITLLLHQ